MIMPQIEVAKEIISIENISSAAALLLLCGYLIFDRKELKKELKEAREENKEKDAMINSFMEKYHVISTKLYEWLK